MRAMQLNDGHVFCTPDQAADEARGALAMILMVFPPEKRNHCIRATGALSRPLVASNRVS